MLQSMKLARLMAAIAIGCGFVCHPAAIGGDSPWSSLIPFKKGPSTDRATYDLTVDHGPWLILAASFTGPKAEKQAESLVRELRSKHKLAAYLHQQTYD